MNRSRPHRRTRLGATVIAMFVTVATSVVRAGTLSSSAGAATPVKAFGSMNAAYLTAPTGTVATLYNSLHHVVGSGTTDSLGALVIHEVTAGAGYRFSLTSHAVTTMTPTF